MNTLFERMKISVEKFWNSTRISLHTLCLLTSAYFVQDGFVTVVDSVFKLISPFFPQSQNDTCWRLLDGFILFTLGYMCVLGLEHGNLNLVRWPTLLLFIYKVLEYFVEQVFQQLKDQDHNHAITTSTTTTMIISPHPHRLEWTGHFLIPSLHIAFVTLFLFRFVNVSHNPNPNVNSNTNINHQKKFAKFVPLKTRRLGVGSSGCYTKFGTCSIKPQPCETLAVPLPKKRRKPEQRQKLLHASTSFCQTEEISGGGGESDEESFEDHVCLLEFHHNQHQFEE